MENRIKLKDATLNELLRGGFVLPHDSKFGLIILIRGKAGTGKSTLALQLLDQLKGPRYYCTLEQSKTDLTNKLIAMRVCKALQHAQRADYNRKVFVYDMRWVERVLEGFKAPEENPRALKTTIAAVARAMIAHNRDGDSCLPLYGEPKDRHRDKTKDLTASVAQSVAAAGLISGVEIFDGSSETSEEGPFHGVHSRVVLASQILQKPFRRKSGNRPIVVLDGLSLLSASEREVLEVQGLVDQLRRQSRVGILVYEPSDDKTSNLDHHADMVVELSSHHIERPLSYLIHEMRIRKARYQDSALGNHQFKIRNTGLTFFPSLHFQVQHYNYMDLELKRSGGEGWNSSRSKGRRRACRKGSLIDLMFSPQEGESVVLLGPRNSYKTQICLDFLARGSWDRRTDREHGLLVSLMDNARSLERGLRCSGQRGVLEQCTGCENCDGGWITHARPFCLRPGCITPAEFFYYLKQRILQNQPVLKRLVFWDLTQMDYRFPLFKEDKMLLPALMDYFKTKEIKSLFMGAGNADNTRAASAMADHVLFCWRSNGSWSPSENEAAGGALMLYVDRTTITGRSGRLLYTLPVDASGQIAWPGTSEELDTLLWTRPDHELDENDTLEIKRIRDMQGIH